MSDAAAIFNSDNTSHTFSSNRHVAVLGAGIVGLASAFWLQREGYKVTLIDQEQPGLGASFGNAGLFADYGRLPFANFAMLRKVPKLLFNKQSPLAIDPSYTPQLLRYGQQYVKACFSKRYIKGREALTHLQQRARAADDVLLQASDSLGLLEEQGFLGLFSDQKSFEAAQKGNLAERRKQGVELRFIDGLEVQALEPNLSHMFAGAVYYPNTRHTVNPVKLSQSIFSAFLQRGGEFIRDKVVRIQSVSAGDKQGVARFPQSSAEIELSTTLNKHTFHHVVIATGAATKPLLQPLGLNIPQVCERGYHLQLENTENVLTRPIAWMDQGVHMTPMSNGIRVAGTAEYTHIDAAPNPQRVSVMQQHAQTMLGKDVSIASQWVGSRPTTPDSLPVIANLVSHPNVTVAFGHGHLGLTLASITGKTVASLVSGKDVGMDLSAFAAERFS